MGFDALPPLLWRAAILLVPGGSVVLALRRGARVAALAVAPAITVGIWYLAGVLGGFLGVGCGAPLVLAVWAILLGAVAVLGHRGPRVPVLGSAPPSLLPWSRAAPRSPRQPSAP